MIISIGTDMVDIRRIECLVQRFGNRFIDKCFTPLEKEKAVSYRSEEKRIARFAKLYAAKEAVLKASGLGLRAGMSWHDIEISNDEMGKPFVSLSGKTSEIVWQQLPVGMSGKIDISLSDDGYYALAFIVVSAYKE